MSKYEEFKRRYFMSKWDQPQELENLDVAFGPKRGGMKKVLPEWLEIPEDFKTSDMRGRGDGKKWINKVDDWFFKGLEITDIVMKNGIDKKMALRHLSCIMHSYEISHEHKTSGVAYLMSLWFEKFEYKVKEKDTNGDSHG